MNAPIKPQIIEQNGIPAFVVIPYTDWMSITNQRIEDTLIPHSIMSRIINENISPIRAWREHLNHTQTDLANQLGISQSAYAQIEAAKRPQKVTKQKIAQALGIRLAQLDI